MKYAITIFSEQRDDIALGREWREEQASIHIFVAVKPTRAFVSPSSITVTEHWKRSSCWKVWQFQAGL